MQDEDQDFDLKTPFVFIDTQSYTELRLDWASRSLKRLQELTQAGTLKLLTTTITKREVRERLAERLAEALAALKKADPLLRQLEIFTAEQFSPDAALQRLVANFEEFLTACHAQCIPLLNMGWRDDIHLDQIDAGGMADWEINIIDRSGTFVSANLNVAVDIHIDVTIWEEQPSFHDYWDMDVTVRHEHIEVTKGIYVEVEALLDRAEEAFEIQAIYVYEVEFDFNRGVGRTGRLSA
ncbi:MAG: hypothetical protein AB7O44_20610 [Hyphomicrobiaceae bacterium]